MILAAGLTPAWQQVLLFETLRLGEVNRAASAHWCASGKVLNAARALHHLGAPSRALTVVGGAAGAALRHDCDRLGLATRLLEVAAPTRICTTLLESARHQATELVENAHPVAADAREAFARAYVEEAAAAAVVVLIGSLPPGTPGAFYRDLALRTPGQVVLDARGEELLLALAAQPFLVKPNRGELAQTLGRTLGTEVEVFAAMHELRRRGAAWVVVTDGAEPIRVCGPGGDYRMQPPPVEVLNPIGCGDCMAAGIAAALDRGLEPLGAVCFGVATAADKLARPLPGAVDPAHVGALARQVVVTQVASAG